MKRVNNVLKVLAQHYLKMALGHKAVSFPLSNSSFNLTSHPVT